MSLITVETVEPAPSTPWWTSPWHPGSPGSPGNSEPGRFCPYAACQSAGREPRERRHREGRLQTRQGGVDGAYGDRRPPSYSWKGLPSSSVPSSRGAWREERGKKSKRQNETRSAANRAACRFYPSQVARRSRPRNPLPLSPPGDASVPQGVEVCAGGRRTVCSGASRACKWPWHAWLLGSVTPPFRRHVIPGAGSLLGARRPSLLSSKHRHRIA